MRCWGSVSKIETGEEEPLLHISIHPNGSRRSENPMMTFKRRMTGKFPGGAVVKNPPANAGDTGSSPGPGRSHMPQSN